MYSRELSAIKKSNRYRKREIESQDLIDFASNDYLGFSEKKLLLEKAFENLQKFNSHAPKSSQLVNGYHLVHKEFEDYLCGINGFSSAIVVGSGFLANFALIEALPRKKDLLILDEEYHASGILASKTVGAEVKYFKHNNMEELANIVKNSDAKRIVVAVEGIYSMSGDLVKKEVFDLCEKYKFLLIVDEAHSVGVAGENLLGVFDLYDIKPTKYHIKMGTLGKALGSYGAYILCSSDIKEYLINRAKALIYTTAPSLFDIELAKQGFFYLSENKDALISEIRYRKKIIKKFFNHNMDGLIFPYKLNSSQDVMALKERLKKIGFIVGAIRPPTVKVPILRIIPRININNNEFDRFCKYLSGDVIK